MPIFKIFNRKKYNLKSKQSFKWINVKNLPFTTVHPPSPVEHGYDFNIEKSNLFYKA